MRSKKLRVTNSIIQSVLYNWRLYPIETGWSESVCDRVVQDIMRIENALMEMESRED